MGCREVRIQQGGGEVREIRRDHDAAKEEQVFAAIKGNLLGEGDFLENLDLSTDIERTKPTTDSHTQYRSNHGCRNNPHNFE